jgi:outer membrane protein TolC
VQAKAAIQSSRTALQRLLLLPDAVASSWHTDSAADKAWLPPIVHSNSALLADAKRQRPIFEVLQAQIEAADAQDRVLQDQLRPQLNLIGQVGSRALSGLSMRTTNDSFDLRDRYVGVGVEFKDTLGKHSIKAALARNDLQREQVLLQHWQTIEQIRTDIATARTDLNNGRENYLAMQQRVKAERRKYGAELQRYREGRSDTATIVQFSGDLRNAELQAALQQITIDLARLRLHLAAGDILTVLTRQSHPSMLKNDK